MKRIPALRRKIPPANQRSSKPSFRDDDNIAFDSRGYHGRKEKKGGKGGQEMEKEMTEDDNLL